MARDSGFDVRQEVLQLLLEKISKEKYPSGVMMNTVEQLLSPDDKQSYAEVLLEKVRGEAHPSQDMLKRLMALA